MYVRENQSFTCPNPKCKRAFADPLFVENLSSEKQPRILVVLTA